MVYGNIFDHLVRPRWEKKRKQEGKYSYPKTHGNRVREQNKPDGTFLPTHARTHARMGWERQGRRNRKSCQKVLSFHFKNMICIQMMRYKFRHRLVFGDGSLVGDEWGGRGGVKNKLIVYFTQHEANFTACPLKMYAHINRRGIHIRHTPAGG